MDVGGHRSLGLKLLTGLFFFNVLVHSPWIEHIMAGS